MLQTPTNIHILKYADFYITNLNLRIWFEYLSILSFCHVLLWPVKDVISCGIYV